MSISGYPVSLSYYSDDDYSFVSNSLPLNEEENALFAAIEQGNEAHLTPLIEKGVNLNITNEKGSTPLHIALEWGQFNCALLLIRNGANIHATDELGMTPLHLAAEKGNVMIGEALIEAGAEIHLTSFYEATPLYLAINGEHFDFISMLMKKGLNLDLSHNSWGWTILHTAAERGHFNLVNQLLKQGANPNIPDHKGKAPLHLAAAGERENLDVVKALLANGAHVTLKDKIGKTPLDYAYDSEYPEICRIIELYHDTMSNWTQTKHQQALAHGILPKTFLEACETILSAWYAKQDNPEKKHNILMTLHLELYFEIFNALARTYLEDKIVNQ